MGKYILIGLLLLASLLGRAEAHFNFVISAGALDNAGMYDAFYQSRIFAGEKAPPFFISNAEVVAYAAHGSVFYCDRPMSAEQVIAAALTPSPVKATVHGLLANSYGGMTLGENLSAASYGQWGSYLGAAQATYEREGRTLPEGGQVWAFSLNGHAAKWPTKAAELVRIPAVVLQDLNSGSRMLIAARSIGSWEGKMALVDALLKDPKAGYLDIGINNGNAAPIDPALIEAVRKRKPLAVFLGTKELVSLTLNPGQLANMPISYPFGPAVESSNPAMKFWSVAHDEKLWPLFGGLGKLYRLKEALELMKGADLAANCSLNVVRVFSETAAIEAAKSVYVDLVLLAVDATTAQLPSQEIIEIQHPALSHEQLAPIVRLSALDVSEVRISGPVLNNIKKVTIIRHQVINKGFEAASYDAENFRTVLPDVGELLKSGRLWQGRDFDSILAGMMLKATKADVAIFESEKNITPIKGTVGFDIARAYLKRPGVITTVTINGKQLKKIAGLIAKRAFNSNLVMFGVDAKARLIRERALKDGERFTVALSEVALLEAFDVAVLGGFSEEYAERAPFVEGISVKLETLLYTSGPRILTTADTAEAIQEAVTGFKARSSFNYLLNTELSILTPAQVKEYITQPAGAPRHTLTLGIDYLDLGFSHNFGNATYESYLKGQNLKAISRASVPLHTHVLLFSKMSLVYDAPGLETTLGNNTKYLHLNQGSNKPERDKTVFNLDFRLPWERSVFRESCVVLSPILKNNYETKLGFIEAFSKANPEEPTPKRLKVLDSLLGTNINFANLGFNVDVGGVMVVDFNRPASQKVQAFDFGPGLNFNAKWSLIGPLEVYSILKSYYLFALPGGFAPNKTALKVEATAWLRVARFYDFSLSLMGDFMAASIQEAPRSVALSSVFGLTVSYGRFFRLFG